MKIKLSLDFLKNLKNVDKKKLLMPILTLVAAIAIIVFIYNALHSILSVSRPRNFIDLDMIEPDGSLNEKKLFQDIEEQRRAAEKNYHREKF